MDRQDMQFEWDEEKNKLNIKKHGISFDTAMLVFSDPHHIEFYDAEHSTDEDRYIALGYVNDVLFVVFVERKEKIRLVSARIATPLERREYYDYNSDT